MFCTFKFNIMIIISICIRNWRNIGMVFKKARQGKLAMLVSCFKRLNIIIYVKLIKIKINITI